MINTAIVSFASGPSARSQSDTSLRTDTSIGSETCVVAVFVGDVSGVELIRRLRSVRPLLSFQLLRVLWSFDHLAYIDSISPVA